MIEFKDVSFTYNSIERHGGVYNIDLSIPQGQVLLLCGESGCGKTTLSRLINGLIPEYYTGTVTGTVKINGTDIRTMSLAELSRIIGSVFQNPRTQFFTLDSTSEIAFGCENIGIEREEMFRRIGRTAYELHIENLLDKNLFSMSGGEKQKIACASVSAMEPSVFVLDEPSSNLDTQTIADLKAIIKNWKVQGKTVIIAEHRLYYLMEIADRVIYMKDGKIEADFPIAVFKRLGTAALRSMGLRSLEAADFGTHGMLVAESGTGIGKPDTLSLLGFSCHYGKTCVLNIPELSVPKGAVIALLGLNGAGKSTFAKTLCGIEKHAKGILEMNGQRYSAKERLKICYLVFQDVNHQLFTESVEEEILLSTETDEKAQHEAVQEAARTMDLTAFLKSHPMSLSGGQKQRVAVASALVSNRDIIIFDEPTSGLDRRHMEAVSQKLISLSRLGKTVFVITHDPELVQMSCSYFVFLESGTVLWSGCRTAENERKVQEFFGSGSTN